LSTWVSSGYLIDFDESEIEQMPNLTDNQKELLRQLVATKQKSILVFKPVNTIQIRVMAPIAIEPQLSDFDELVDAGFLRSRPIKKNQWDYTITNLGHEAVETNFQLPQDTPTTGDTFDMSGNFQGAIINITPPLKEELTQLLEQLTEALTQVPADKVEEAEAVAQTAEQLVENATTEKPNKTTIKISGEGLKQAAKNLAAVVPNVLTIATQIVVTILKSIN
jgi:hypothetical protein